MDARRGWKRGDITFDVHYCPSEHGDKIKAEDPDAWPGDDMKVRVFTDFKSAAEFACDAAQDDWFGCVSIHREVCENPKYDWWGHEGSWEVVKETKPTDLDPETPDNG